MVIAHAILWTIFIVLGLCLWIVAEYGGRDTKLHEVITILFCISVFGVVLSVIALLIKLALILIGF